MPSVKTEYDHRLAGNIGHAYSLNMETIMLGDMNFDYFQKEFKKSSTGQRIEIFLVYTTGIVCFASHQ